MKKMISLLLALLIVYPVCGAGSTDGPDQPERRGREFNHVLTFGIGLHHRDGDAGWGFQTALGIGWEGWLTRRRIFGFYFDGNIVLDQANSLGLMSYGIGLSFPYLRSWLRGFMQLGFGYGKDNNGAELFSMPLTVGTSIWFTKKFGLKISFRYHLLCKEDMLQMSAGLFTVL